MKIKTAELTGAALNWAVAQAELTQEDYRERGLLVHRIGYGQPMPPYSTDWAQGGPIIERERLWLQPEIGKEGTANAWYCVALTPFDAYGTTPLIAAMRCYVASKLGDEVDVPEEVAL